MEKVNKLLDAIQHEIRYLDVEARDYMMKPNIDPIAEMKIQILESLERIMEEMQK